MEPQAAGPAQLPTSPPATTKCWRPTRPAPNPAPTNRPTATLLFRAAIRRVRVSGARPVQGRPSESAELAGAWSAD